MGSLSCKQRKTKPESADNDHQRETTGTRPEDVLYASIDHTTINPERNIRQLEDNDCDYAVVKLPQMSTDIGEHKSSEDCSDDYVLMG